MPMTCSYGGTTIHIEYSDFMHPMWIVNHRYSRINVPYGTGGDRLQYGGRGDDTLDVQCIITSDDDGTANNDFFNIQSMVGFQKRSLNDFYGQSWSNVRLESLSQVVKSVTGPPWVFRFRASFTRRPDNG